MARNPNPVGAKLVLLGLSLLAGLGCGKSAGRYALPAPGAARGSNLILLTLDTTRADHLGCYGDAEAHTPNLDALAAGGVRFTHAITAVPVTLPAHATILTGLYPPHHGVRHNAEYRLGPGTRTLAESLNDQGYTTAAFVSAFVLDARFGLAQGFDVYDDKVQTESGGVFAAGTVERPAVVTTDAALAWLEHRDRSRPFFLWVHYFDAHAPYQPPAEVARLTPGRPYDGEIAYVDREIGRLLAGLDAATRGKTLITAVADHGEGLGDHGEATHAFFVYDSTTRVPLVMQQPGVIPPGIEDGVVSTADLTPTLLDLLGIADPQPRDGVSLLGLARDRERGVYLECLAPLLDYGWAPLTALRRADAKLIEAPRSELYDLAADPGETRNLYREAASGSRREGLARQMEELVAGWPSFDSTSGTPALGAQDAAKLHALGYLSGAGTGPAGEKLLDPKDQVGVVAGVLAANQFLQAGRRAEALKMAEIARQQSPNDRTVLQLLGKLYVSLGRLPEAEAALRAFTAIRPKADVSLLLAQIVLQQGHLDEAERLLAQAETLEPEHGGVAIARGDLFLARGQRAEALAAYARAAAIDPYRAGGLAAVRRQQVLSRTRDKG